MSKNDAVFTTFYKKIVIPNINTQLIIQPFGDVHRDSPNCAEEKWKLCLDWMKRQHNENTYYLSMGDLNDFASHSERDILNNPKLHGSTRENLEKNLAVKPVERIFKEIEFMKPNLIGMLEGNHRWEFEDGTTSTQLLCDKLDCKWLGEVTYIRLSINIKTRTRTQLPVDIVAAHGKAGGKLAGTTINQVEDLKRVFPMADIFIMGHDHHRGAWPTSTLDVLSRCEGLVIKQKRQWLARSGSFLRGYVDGEQSYIVKRMLRPTDIGIIRFFINIERKRYTENGVRKESYNKDIHVWE